MSKLLPDGRPTVCYELLLLFITSISVVCRGGKSIGVLEHSSYNFLGGGTSRKFYKKCLKR